MALTGVVASDDMLRNVAGVQDRSLRSQQPQPGIRLVAAELIESHTWDIHSKSRIDAPARHRSDMLIRHGQRRHEKWSHSTPTRLHRHVIKDSAGIG